VPSIPTTKTTAVLVIETAKPGVTAQQIMAVIPAEIRATVKLYLEGKIQQWYSRGDGRGSAAMPFAIAEGWDVSITRQLLFQSPDHRRLRHAVALGELLPSSDSADGNRTQRAEARRIYTN
jgi:hypothetical protein